MILNNHAALFQQRCAMRLNKNRLEFNDGECQLAGGLLCGTHQLNDWVDAKVRITFFRKWGRQGCMRGLLPKSITMLKGQAHRLPFAIVCDPKCVKNVTYVFPKEQEFPVPERSIQDLVTIEFRAMVTTKLGFERDIVLDFRNLRFDH